MGRERWGAGDAARAMGRPHERRSEGPKSFGHAESFRGVPSARAAERYGRAAGAAGGRAATRRGALIAMIVGRAAAADIARRGRLGTSGSDGNRARVDGISIYDVGVATRIKVIITKLIAASDDVLLWDGSKLSTLLAPSGWAGESAGGGEHHGGSRSEIY